MYTKYLTFEKLPEAVVFLIGKVEELTQSLQVMSNQPTIRADSWMNIEELIDYLPSHPAKATIYGWVSGRNIPHHKSGKNLRFLKSEIDNWLLGGKRKSETELEAEAQQYLNNNKNKIYHGK